MLIAGALQRELAIQTLKGRNLTTLETQRVRCSNFRQYWTDKRLVFNSSQVGGHSHTQDGAGIAWCRWTSWCSTGSSWTGSGDQTHTS